MTLSDFVDRPGAALVLGASGGLGSVIAELLADRGSRLALTFRRPGGVVGELLERPHVEGRGYQLDLLDAAACARVIDQVVADFGAVHTVVYAAGPFVPMLHLSRVAPAQLRAQLAADAGAFFNAISPTLPHLRSSRGSVVAVTTAATARFPARDGLSSVPKAAIEALVRGIAAEEGRFGIRANCVGPGLMNDGMAQRLIAAGDLDDRALEVARGNIALGHFGTARDVAEAVCFLASDRAAYITGQKLDVDGGYSV